MTRTLAMRRIVVALDDSADSRSVLEEAVALAARMRAEVAGLFVEDATLLNAAELGVVRQVSLNGQSVETMDTRTVQRALRGQAEAMRGALERAALRHNLSWSFTVERGKASHHILAAVDDTDLMILGKTAPAVTRHHRLGSTARMVATTPRGSILFSEPRLRRVLGGPGPIAVAYGRGPSGDAVLDMAVHLAHAGQSDLLVLVPGDDGASAEEAVRARLADEEIDVQFRSCPHRGAAAIAHVLSAQRGNLVIVAQDSPILGADTVADLIETLDSPVLVVAPT